MRRWESEMERAGRPWRMNGLLIVWAIGGHCSGNPLADCRTHISSVSPRDKEASLFIYQFLEELKVTLGDINSPSLLVSWCALIARECSPAVMLLVCMEIVCG